MAETSKKLDYIAKGGGPLELAQAQLEHTAGYLGTEIEENRRLRTLLLDACKVFDHYDLPEHALYYRRQLGMTPKEALTPSPVPEQGK